MNSGERRKNLKTPPSIGEERRRRNDKLIAECRQSARANREALLVARRQGRLREQLAQCAAAAVAGGTSAADSSNLSEWFDGLDEYEFVELMRTMEEELQREGRDAPTPPPHEEEAEMMPYDRDADEMTDAPVSSTNIAAVPCAICKVGVIIALPSSTSVFQPTEPPPPPLLSCSSCSFSLSARPNLSLETFRAALGESIMVHSMQCSGHPSFGQMHPDSFQMHCPLCSQTFSIV